MYQAHSAHITPYASQDSIVSFSFTPPAPPETYTLSLHDALPISGCGHRVSDSNRRDRWQARRAAGLRLPRRDGADRKSTRLNSSHQIISYAVFCLKKKKFVECRRSNG